jgi:hypothetical protein
LPPPGKFCPPLEKSLWTPMQTKFFFWLRKYYKVSVAYETLNPGLAKLREHRKTYIPFQMN